MVKLERRLLVDATLIGVLITLIVGAADSFGLLSPLERWFYDQRALRCQHWMPKPTTELVHLDIDGASLEAVGAWPWDRRDVAAIVDEIGRAKPKAVALDVLFAEPQKPAGDDGPDAALAESIRRLGNCVVAASFPFRRDAVSPLFDAVRTELVGDAEQTEADVTAKLAAKGHAEPDLAAQVHDVFYSARRAALRQRVAAEGEGVDEETLREKLVPKSTLVPKAPVLGNPAKATAKAKARSKAKNAGETEPLQETAAYNAFKAALTEVRAARALRRLSVPLPAGHAPVAQNGLGDAPLAPLSDAAAAGGFVDYPQFADGKVRAVPLLMGCDGATYPQLGLALAWKVLGADASRLKVSEHEVVIPRGGLGDLRVPVRTLPARELLGMDRDVPLAVNASWFGTGDWAAMYDTTAHRVPRQHLPLTAVWDACQIHRRIIENNKTAEAVIMQLSEEVFEAPGYEDVEGFGRKIDAFLRTVQPADDDPEVAQRVAKLRAIGEQNPGLSQELTLQRERLRSLLRDKAVLVGWTATGVIADFLPTSLHPRCPGVVLHGVIFNQIMTGEVWRTMPKGVTLLVTLAIGLATTLAVSFLSPLKASVSAALLVVGYLLVNGYLLFDYGNMVLGAAGPVVAAGAVFSGGTLAKLAMERWERARITRRFSSYVDPKVVDYVVKHPDQAHFEGQVREMTVVFCDVAGFTTLTEKYGSETVPMLNELWGVMVPVIRRNGGIVNKFLGDGVMFFFGAPEQSPHHARDAVAAVLAMRKALEEFNRTVAAGRKWPALALRYGVSTGTMVVGDAGSADTGAGNGAADYTVLGDNVNLGSRLEGANKAVGTGALVTGRTVELSKDSGVLFRPVGKLCVVGKREGVMTYEPVARLDDATEAQKQLAAETKEMVEAFLAGRLPECISAVQRIEAAYGPGKLTQLYRDRCEWFLRDPSPEPFDCQIVLTEK